MRKLATSLEVVFEKKSFKSWFVVTLKSRKYPWVRNQASLCAVVKRRLKSEFLEAEIFDLKKNALFWTERGRNRTSLVLASPAGRHTSMSWWWGGSDRAFLPGTSTCRGCGFCKGCVTWACQWFSRFCEIHIIPRRKSCLQLGGEKMVPEELLQLFVLRQEMLTQQLAVICCLLPAFSCCGSLIFKSCFTARVFLYSRTGSL